jgi:uncharacterized protein (TIGR02217 family)
MSDFHDILFPIKIARGAVGGPMRATSIKTNGVGKEVRNTPFYNSRRRWEIASKGSNIDELSEIIDFYEARMGRLFGFRFRDPMDSKSCSPKTNPSVIDQEIGIGDGTKKDFQLIKKYGDAKGQYLRKITKPVANSVLIAIDGIARPHSEYAINYLTGIISFSTAPASAAAISAGFMFDTPVRFDNDSLDFELDGFGTGQTNTIILIEVL